MKRGSGPRSDPAKTRAWEQRSRRPLTSGKRKARRSMPAAAVAAVHARTSGRCVVCLYDGAPMRRAGRAVHRHHVFPVQDVYWPELELEPDGQVGVCFGCHMAHENGSRRIPLGALPRCAFELAARTSQRAVDYLLSTYPETGPCAAF